jgi:hypothetical protein
MRLCIIAICLFLAASFGVTPAFARCPMAAADAADAPCPMHQAPKSAAALGDDVSGQPAGDHGKCAAKMGCSCIAHSAAIQSTTFSIARSVAHAAPNWPAVDQYLSHLPEQSTPPPKAA